MSDLVTIAKVARPHGIRGEVTADILTDFPERFAELESVIAKLADASRAELKIEKFRFHQHRVMLKFAGIDTVEDAEQLRNAEICIDEADAVELEPDEYFDWELEGCRGSTLAGLELGTVAEVMRTGGTEILVIRGGEKEFLVPFAEAICVEVDIENKRIVVDPPEGLLEF
ncbi:MAG: ribosome maturation factor RimM [Acidobacteria bacterium]|nr:ribosome maturation factor RimM [Acidobacteriota bacterium]